MVVERITPRDGEIWDPRSGVPPRFEESDIVWVECAAVEKMWERKAWRDVMRVAVERLERRNEKLGERVLVVLAVGWRWLVFVWDPIRGLE